MTGFDLRPLSLGEILDRTFTLYRKHFALFFGIAAFPQILILAIQLMAIFVQPVRQPDPAHPFAFLNGQFVAITLVTIVVALVAYLFSQGGAMFAVSEIYLGRQITIAEALGKVRGHLGFLLGVILLNGLVIGLASLLFLIPGIYLACRLIACVPCALIEEKGPSASLSRSFSLTKGFAGRSFMIYVMYFAIAIVASMLFSLPFTPLIVTSAGDPLMVRIWTSCSQIGGAISSALVTPILTIAISIFYYDLRVRKEAFDIQFMMNPELNPPGPSDMPSIL